MGNFNKHFVDILHPRGSKSEEGEEPDEESVEGDNVGSLEPFKLGIPATVQLSISVSNAAFSSQIGAGIIYTIPVTPG